MHRHEHDCGPGGRRGRGPRGIFFGPRGLEMNFGPLHFEFGEDFGDRGFRGGGGRGPRGRRRMFGSGELRLVLLKLISDEPRHGYDLIRAIEALTGGDYAPSPGVVYPTLTMLADMGLVEEVPAEGSRKSYAATDEGRAHLAENQAEVEALLERLDEAKPEVRKTGHPPIHRALHNLRVVIQVRTSDERFTEEFAHEITDILDEAAQRIERLK